MFFSNLLISLTIEGKGWKEVLFQVLKSLVSKLIWVAGTASLAVAFGGANLPPIGVCMLAICLWAVFFTCHAILIDMIEDYSGNRDYSDPFRR